jgi:TonB-dependent receptor
VAKGTPLDSSGLVGSTISAIIPGVYDFRMPLVSPSLFWSAFGRNGGFNTTWSPDNYNGDTVKGDENVASGYVTANFKFNNVEVIPGLRFEHTDVHDIYWVSGNNGVDADGVHYGWASSNSHFDELLPSLLVNWRPESNAVYRAAVWTSYTRPPFIELAGNTSTSVDSDGNVHITKGNPNLKAIEAVNFDASGAWTNNFGGAASVALFYKHLSNYIYNGGGNFSTVSTMTGAQTTVSQPLNGGDGNIYGVELEARQMFPSLPGFWSGFGVSGNATFQASQVDLDNPDLSSTERMQNAPTTLFNVSLLYRKYGLSGDLNGLWGTTSFGSPFNSSALDQWVHAHQQLDLNLAYALPHGVQLRFAATNLTNSVTYYDTIGRNSSAAPEIVEGGRTFQLGARYAF